MCTYQTATTNRTTVHEKKLQKMSSVISNITTNLTALLVRHHILIYRDGHCKHNAQEMEIFFNCLCVLQKCALILLLALHAVLCSVLKS